MPRPVTWLPRLDAMRRSVSESVRSHYDSGDLQRLFQIQPRSAQLLLSLLPTQTVGKSLLVERMALLAFLDHLLDAEDPAQELNAMKERGKPATVRRKLRMLIQRDVDAELTDLPENVDLKPGKLSVGFQSVEELATALMRLALLMQDDLDGFASHYEPIPVIDEAEALQRELERADAAYIRQFLAGETA